MHTGVSPWLHTARACLSGVNRLAVTAATAAVAVVVVAVVRAPLLLLQLMYSCGTLHTDQGGLAEDTTPCTCTHPAGATLRIAAEAGQVSLM